MFNLFKKKLAGRYLVEVTKRKDLAAQYRYLADLVGRNTVLVPEGTTDAKKYLATAELIERDLNEYIRQALMVSGFPMNTNYQVKRDGTVENAPVENNPAPAK